MIDGVVSVECAPLARTLAPRSRSHLPSSASSSLLRPAPSRTDPRRQSAFSPCCDAQSMTGVGQSRHIERAPDISGFPFTPDVSLRRNEPPVRAKRRYMQRSKDRCYSITSSAMETSVGGTSTPIARAVARLMMSSNRAHSAGNEPWSR